MSGACRDTVNMYLLSYKHFNSGNMDVMYVIIIVYHSCRVSIAIVMKPLFRTPMQLQCPSNETAMQNRLMKASEHWLSLRLGFLLKLTRSILAGFQKP